jgi:excisionase family DNA binding protein
VIVVPPPDTAATVARLCFAHYARELQAGRTPPDGLEHVARAFAKLANVRQPDPLPARLDLDHAAQVAQVSRRTLERRIAAGDLQAVRDGGRTFVARDVLERWLRQEPTTLRQDATTPPDGLPDPAPSDEQPTDTGEPAA